MDYIRENLRKIMFLARKELLATLSDKRCLLILTVPILVQCGIFGYVASYNLTDVPYVVYDQSKSRASNEVLQKLNGSGIFRLVQTCASEKELSDYIDAGDAIVGLVFEREFAKHVERGGNAKLQTIVDGRNSTTAGLALGYVNEIVSDLNAQKGSFVKIITHVWYNPNEITRYNYLSGLTPMLCLIQIMLLAGLSVARERENGTFDQLLVTPLTTFQILWGKAIPPLIIGLLQALIAVLICDLWFHIPMVGSWLLLFFTLTVFMLSVVGLGLCISAISETMQQVMVYCMSLLLPLALLSGHATPVQSMPVLLQYATYLNPLRFAVEAARMIYFTGASFDELIMCYVPMLVVAAITLPLAAHLFRSRLS